MKFLRTKAAAIFIAVISILCVVAACIAINISIVMIKKKDQAINPVPIEQTPNIQVSAKPVKTNKLEEQGLYYNGQLIEGLQSFTGTGDSCFIAIDAVLTELGIKFTYFAPDDILEFVLNGKKVTIKINQNEVTVGKEKIKLKYAVQAAKNHILVPEELMSHLEGFGVTRFSDRKAVFLNYFPNVRKYSDTIRVLKTSNGVANISDIIQNKYYWKSRNESIGDDRVMADDDGSQYIIKVLNKVFLVRDGQGYKPKLINADVSATWSANGKYLYWVDKDKGLSYGFDIDNGEVESLGDYFLRIKSYLRDSNGKSIYDDGGLLYDYGQGRRYKRLVLTNEKYSSNYTFLERKGKTLIESPVSFSPDHKRLLYYEGGKGYYSVNVDGTNRKFVGAGISATWINNKRIMLIGNNGIYMVSGDGKEITGLETPWRKLGQTPKGDVFYTDGDKLYCESNGNEMELLRLVVPCDYIFSNDTAGPYIAASSEQDKVYLIKKGTVDVIGTYGQLLKGTGIKSPRPWGKSMLTSPNGKFTSIARNVDGFVNIDIIDDKVGDIRTLTLNHMLESSKGTNEFNMKWISDTVLVLYTLDRGWLINLEGEKGIYNWIEGMDDTIKAILLK